MPAGRVGILGGTFDPIHYGHLAIANEAAYVLDLDPVLFAPAGQPPHKHGEPVSPAELRVAMTALAIADNPRFRLTRIDVDHAGLSYTVDLLVRLREALGPDPELFFILGMDSLLEIRSWHQPERLFQLCQVVATTRPGYPVADLAALARDIPASAGRVILLRAPGLDIAASELRERVVRGLPLRYLVPPEVEAFIARHRLYAGAEH